MLHPVFPCITLNTYLLYPCCWSLGQHRHNNTRRRTARPTGTVSRSLAPPTPSPRRDSRCPNLSWKVPKHTTSVRQLTFRCPSEAVHHQPLRLPVTRASFSQAQCHNFSSVPTHILSVPKAFMHTAVPAIHYPVTSHKVIVAGSHNIVTYITMASLCRCQSY